MPGLGRSLGERKGYPLQYSCLENSTDCIVHGFAKSSAQLRTFTSLCNNFKWSITYKNSHYATLLRLIKYCKSTCCAQLLSHVWLLTLCNPMDCSLSGFSVYGIFQARMLEWVAISCSRGSSGPRNRTWSLWPLALAGEFFKFKKIEWKWSY